MPRANRSAPANGSETEQVIPLLDSAKVKTNRHGRPRKRLKVLAYDSKQKRAALHQRRIWLQWPLASLEEKEKSEYTN